MKRGPIPGVCREAGGPRLAVASMQRAVRSSAVIVVMGLFSLAPAVLAEGEGAGHPAAIHSGSCELLGEQVADLGAASADAPVDGMPAAGSPRVGSSSSNPLQAGVTTVPLSLDEVLSTEHSIVLRDGDDGVVACGAIGGRMLPNAMLPVALTPRAESGYAALALLSDLGDDSTELALYLVAMPAAVETTVPTADALALGTELSYAGWAITIEEVALDRDPEAREPLVVTAVFTNHSARPRDLAEAVRGTNAYIDADEEIYPLYLDDNVKVPFGASVRARLNTRALPEGFSLDRAVLTFGHPSQHQARLRLATDAEGEAFFPLDLDSAGRANLKKIGQVRVHSAALMAVTCRGSADELVLDPAPRDELSIVLQADSVGRAPVGRSVDTSIVAPDGITALGVPARIAMRKGTVDRGIQLCYPIGLPAGGEYVIRFDGDDRSAKYKITVPSIEAPADASTSETEPTP